MSSISASASFIRSLPRPFHAPPFHSLRNTACLWQLKKNKNKKQNLLFRVLPFDLSPPPIDLDPFPSDTAVNEALVSEADTSIGHENVDEALDAVENGVAVVDLSAYGRIRVSGDDRVQFLHNQTTANFECLSEGQGCDTVFVTPTARTIDLAHAWIMKNSIVLVVSPTTCGSIIQMLNKYIFFSDKVEIQDITNQTSMLALLGPKSSEVMKDLNLGDLIGQPYGSHKHYSVNEMPLTVAVGSIVSTEGFTFMMSKSGAGLVLSALMRQGVVRIGPAAWEKLRIIRGRPSPGKELTDEFNVLEANLWRSISLNKGCYKGQETISRLITYDGIKQRLWGIRLSSPVESGSIITVDGKKVGKLTSLTDCGHLGSEPFGLGYVRKRAASEGDTVIIGENNVVGTLVEVPFLKDQTTVLEIKTWAWLYTEDTNLSVEATWLRSRSDTRAHTVKSLRPFVYGFLLLVLLRAETNHLGR